jgi:hypothetical protein
MTKLLEEALQSLRQLPDAIQDQVARVILSQIEEEPEPGDLEAIEEARREFANSDFVTLSPTQAAEVRRVQRRLREGKTRLATDAEVAAVRRKLRR